MNAKFHCGSAEAGQAKIIIAAIFAIPAKAGIQAFGCVPPIQMDSGLRRNDDELERTRSA